MPRTEDSRTRRGAAGRRLARFQTGGRRRHQARTKGHPNGAYFYQLHVFTVYSSKFDPLLAFGQITDNMFSDGSPGSSSRYRSTVSKPAENGRAAASGSRVSVHRTGSRVRHSRARRSAASAWVTPGERHRASGARGQRRRHLLCPVCLPSGSTRGSALAGHAISRHTIFRSVISRDAAPQRGISSRGSWCGVASRMVCLYRSQRQPLCARCCPSRGGSRTFARRAAGHRFGRARGHPHRRSKSSLAPGHRSARGSGRLAGIEPTLATNGSAPGARRQKPGHLRSVDHACRTAAGPAVAGRHAPRVRSSFRR
jgi:hypothetical protein